MRRLCSRSLFLLTFIVLSLIAGMTASAQSQNIALGCDTSESDPGWGGGSYPKDMTDGKTCYYDTWAHGLAFCGGIQQWCGQPCGWRQATVNLGGIKTFDRVLVWHHGDDHIPSVYNLEYWDGGNWAPVGGSTTVRYDLRSDTLTWGAVPTENCFPAVTGSKVRFRLDNCNITHGWIYEFEVFQSCPGAQSVPYFHQCDPPWGTEAYDHYPPYDICKKGCALTSAAMVINYHALAQGLSNQTDPGLLNEWLKNEKDGYSGFGVNWIAVERYAQQVIGLTAFNFKGIVNRDDPLLRQYLCNKEPQILHLPHHFVVATGEDNSASPASFKIKDPGYRSRTDLRVYGNTYQSLRLFSLTRTRSLPALHIGITGVRFMITDSLGNRTGYDPDTDTVLNEIPGGYYESLDIWTDPLVPENDNTTHYTFDMPNPPSGNYSVKVFGDLNKPLKYKGYFFGYDENRSPSTAIRNGLVNPGESVELAVTYSTAPGAQIKVTPGDTQKNLIGSFGGLGVWCRNSADQSWKKLNDADAVQIVCGDIDGDGLDDLVGWWNTPNGIWVRYGDGSWEKILSAVNLISLTTGDWNGDGQEDIIGSWKYFGVWRRDSATKNWQQMKNFPVATPPQQITSADINGDGRDDLLAWWDTSGLWFMDCSNGSWEQITDTNGLIRKKGSSLRDPADFKCVRAGDLNGDGLNDMVISWQHFGVVYRDSLTWNWAQLFSSAADLITTGDLDGGGNDDLLGVWNSVPGLWVRYSETGAWEKLHDLSPIWITAGNLQ